MTANRSIILQAGWKIWPVLLWMTLIFFLSHQDGKESSETSEWVLKLLMAIGFTVTQVAEFDMGFWVRKSAHFTEFLVLTLLTYYFLADKKPWPQSVWIAWIVAVVYACTDEFHQSFIPFRRSTPFDVGVDALGGLLALALIFLFRNKTRPQASA